MKLSYYLKVGFKVSVINFIAGLIVMIPAIMFVFPILGLSALSVDSSISSTLSFSYLIIIPILWVVQGFALHKYRGWIFK